MLNHRNFFSRHFFFDVFFFNHIYSMRKAHFWGFPEILGHLEKDIDYQSGQAKNPKFSFLEKSGIFCLGIFIICFKMYLNQFQIVSSTLGNQTATILMIFRVRKSNFGSPDLKFHILSVKYGFLLCHFIGRY